MGNATMVVMAAGIGSRFGEGVKQLKSVGPNGEILMEYALYDAIKAGFDKVVFVIRKDLEDYFNETIGNRLKDVVEFTYVFQEIEDIPEEYSDKAKERKKPWGTGQAIACCKNVINEPFVVINADDYYGEDAYKNAYEYLTGVQEKSCNDKLPICMVGFVLENTLSENGGVTRGVCELNDEGHLVGITETYKIMRDSDGIIRDREGVVLDEKAMVSMNLWGFTHDFFDILEKGFTDFLENLPEDINKAEYLLPTIVGTLVRNNKACVTVLPSDAKWFGITFPEDLQKVKDEIADTISKKYPSPLYK
ncbi:MAG: nucleotidyltransferase [Lachnospiraceae bacterium]|jgi:UTP-glucose-1-phosphate uridylyltransferase|nr:nucleotidyltransferase [Lachnospiraceae bacterium]